MTIPVKPMTAEEFVAWTQQPENLDKRLELIDGVIYEVTSNSKSSSCAMQIVSFISPLVRINKLGTTTGADGGYTFDGHYIVPDFAFVSYERQPEQPDIVYNPIVPDFALEVVSPSDVEHPAERIDKKVEKYLAAKIRLLWLAYPARKEIKVYANGAYVRTAGINDTLDGGDVFPGLSVPVNEVF